MPPGAIDPLSGAGRHNPRSFMVSQQERSGLHETGVVLVTRLLGVFAGIATQICLAWFLAPTGRGEFAVCTTFAVLLGALAGLGFDRAVQYHMVSGGISRSEAIGLALVTVALNSLLAIAIGWFVIDLPIGFFDKATAADFRVALLLVPAVALSTALSLLLDGARLYRAGAAVATVTSLANLLLIVLLVELAGLGVGGAVLSWVLASAAGCALQLRLLNARPSLPGMATGRNVASYASRYYLARLGNVINVEIGLIVLAMIATTSEIGLYSAASVLIGKLMIGPQALSTVVLPRVGGSPDGQSQLVARTCRISSIFLAAGLSALALLAPVIVPLALSPSFAPAVPVVWMLALGVWARGLTMPITSYFVGIDRPGLISILTTLELLLGIIFMVPAYRLHGIAGAALGGSAAYLVVAAARVFWFRRLSGGTAPMVWFARREDWRYLLDAVDRVLGIPPSTRGLVDREEGVGNQHGAERLTRVLPDRVIKQQVSDRVAHELLKTRLGAKIGAECGSYRVPELLDDGISVTSIAFLRLGDATPLWHFLCRRPSFTTRIDVVRRAAAALADVHAHLTLPESERVEIDEQWWLAGRERPVALHGDYTAFNLLLTDAGRALWVTDWATSDVLGRKATVGPGSLEVAWFVASLFFQSHCGLRRVPGRERLAGEFVDEYCRKRSVDRSAVLRYLALFAAKMTRLRPPLRVRLRRVRHELLAEPALLLFAQRAARHAAAGGGR